ncbi:hypothetical protein BWD42_23725 [Sphingobacterium sp. CZ-UAM]|uniref:hypothetical protein n=1 Tax=Sphingobacterium sp. CZ-UAM TaxID=1933868 RepID=UPI000986648F|nr:hypothetical protein [Sphingobacterium sp. CZ-UAM]OOG15888.1 hypothetical protein BWD42_23725 [Sphingobacterium sp. CZ-UAM]
MKKTIIITILLFIAVIVATIYLFGDFNKNNKQDSKALQYLPENTLAITSFANNEAVDTIFKDYELFKAVLGQGNFSNLEQLKAELLQNEQLTPFVAGQQILLSFHQEKDQITALYSVQVGQSLDNNTLEKLMGQVGNNYKVQPFDTLGQRFFGLNKGVKDSTLYCAYAHEIIFASYSKQVLAQIFDKNVKKINNKQIEFFVNHNNKNTPLSLYFFNEQSAQIARILMKSKFGTYLNLIDSLKGQTSWNMNFKQDALIFKGETDLTGSKNSYLQLFANQTAQVQALGNYLPKNAASYIDFSISDAASFHAGLKDLLIQQKEYERISKSIKNFEEDSKVSFDSVITPLFNDEFALAELDNQDVLGLISLSDSSLFANNFKKFSSDVGDSIYQFKYSQLLYASFGEPFKSFTRPYFTIVDNIMVVASRTEILRDYRESFREKQFLSGTAIFKNHAAIQNSRSNVTFYLEPKAAKSNILDNLKSDYAKNFKDEEQFGFQNFYSWSYQLSGNQGTFASSLYGLYKSDTRLGGKPEWTVQLENRIINKPWILDQDGKNKFIMIQEQDHTVHAFSPDGKELWQNLFQGEILGEPIQLQDLSIVMVTKSRLYRILPDGKNINGFSVELPSSASYGATITNFNKEQRIYIPATDRILAYTLDGKKVEGMENNTVDSRILFDLKTTTLGQTNYIIAGTSTASVYFFNEYGKVIRKQTLDTEGESIKNPIGLVAASDEKNSFVYVADNKGSVFKVPFEGEVKKIKLGTWGKDAFFNFEDISGGADRDFIILANNKLNAYSARDSSSYFEYKFIEEASNRPLFFKRIGKSDVLGVGTDNRMIYVFGSDGLVQEGFPIEGFSKFYYGPINYGDNANYLICMKKDFKVYVYKF